jgi:hypothetical protein
MTLSLIYFSLKWKRASEREKLHHIRTIIEVLYVHLNYCVNSTVILFSVLSTCSKIIEKKTYKFKELFEYEEKSSSKMRDEIKTRFCRSQTAFRCDMIARVRAHDESPFFENLIQCPNAQLIIRSMEIIFFDLVIGHSIVALLYFSAQHDSVNNNSFL